MNDKKNKYVIPEAEIICFNNEDIITLSGGVQRAMTNGLWDEEDDNTEGWL